MLYALLSIAAYAGRSPNLDTIVAKWSPTVRSSSGGYAQSAGSQLMENPCLPREDLGRKILSKDIDDISWALYGQGSLMASELAASLLIIDNMGQVKEV